MEEDFIGLAISEMKQIIDQISKYTNNHNYLVTVEINPEDVTETLLRGYSELGVNRLSISQSLNDDILNWMNRSHNKALHLFF